MQCLSIWLSNTEIFLSPNCLPGTLLVPSDVVESSEALAETANVWRMQVKDFNVFHAQHEFKIDILALAQGEPEGLCWVDADGNEIEDDNVGEVEIYGEGDALPTLVVDTNTRTVKQVGDNETFPYVCQFPEPSEGNQ